MKTAASVAAALAFPALSQATLFDNEQPISEARAVSPSKGNDSELVTSEKLQALITLEDLLSGSQKLQDIADAHGGNRAFGSGGHNATVDWLAETLEKTGYFDVEKQPFTELFATADGTFSWNGNEVETDPLTYTPGGSVKGPIVQVNNLGCVADDFPAEVDGAIAFISRGECTFGEKAHNAYTAGAAGAIIYNNQDGSISGTLGDPYVDYAPVLGISKAAGDEIAAALAEGTVEGDLVVDATVEDRVNYNVIAETKEGDHDNVLILGGHSDSVAGGPGIK